MMKKNIKILLIIFLVVLIDQIAKLIIKNTIGYGVFVKVIGNFFRITYVENTGAAWSILEGKIVLLTLLSLVFLSFLIYCAFKEKKSNKLNVLSYGFIIGGILGNMLDRIFYKKVIDFLAFKIFNYNFPVFNIADSFIVIGAILFIIDMILEGKDEGPMIKEYKKIKEQTSGKNSSRGK